MAILGYIEKELECLETRAHALAQDYYRWAKASGRLIKLRVRARKMNGTLRIEWSTPSSWSFFGTDAKVISRHLPKGNGKSYPVNRLLRYVQPEHRDKVLEYEERFAEIRKAARLLGRIKRLARQYEQQLTRCATSPAVRGGEQLGELRSPVIKGEQNGQHHAS